MIASLVIAIKRMLNISQVIEEFTDEPMNHAGKAKDKHNNPTRVHYTELYDRS